MKRAIILSIFFLCTPSRADAEGKSDMAKTMPCSNVPPIALVQEPDIVFVPVPFAVNIFKAIAGVTASASAAVAPCKMKNRIRWNGGCWLPERIPK